jgi:glycosyltransferase involved in cell wall biosynthesis
MDVYADSLRAGLREYGTGRWDVNDYTPHFPRGLSYGNWSMRFARYAAYPFQARCRQARINHVLDHGYGHLLYALDPARTVVTVHDLIPLVRWCGGIAGVSCGDKPWLNLLSFYALRRAGHLIADSESTLNDLIRFCNCAHDQITVVYPGLDSIFRPYTSAERLSAARTFGLEGNDAKRIMIIGSGFYKNFSGALAAFARLRALYDQPIVLVKVGQMDAEKTRLVRELGLAGMVLKLPNVSRTQLPDIYNLVDCLLFPSHYEGFGWPPIEAMACGTPVVASNAGSLPEVIGDAGIMCEPNDIEALAHSMHDLLSVPALREEFVQRGLLRAKHFTWQETVRKTLDVYERMSRL